MRKLIAILLITAIACDEVDTTPKAEESKYEELLEMSLSTILKFQAKAVTRELKKIGIWDQFVSIVKNGGKHLAFNFCLKYLSKFDCKTLIDFGTFK